jgi:hypothetical protein
MHRTIKRGILAASDDKLEWLLSWWWTRLRRHSDLPIAFVDLGMSDKGRAFCREKGTLLSLSTPLLPAKKEHIPADRAARWETLYGVSLWNARESRLKKPIALLATPFEETLWLDLDCEVLASLDPLFDYLKESDFAIASETEAAHVQERSYGELGEEESLFNSGVMVYRHASSLLHDWARDTLQRGDQFWGDQQVLSRLISEKQIQITQLDPRYNWRMSQGFNLDAQIIHWVGSWGKEYIRLHGGLGDDLAALPRI